MKEDILRPSCLKWAFHHRGREDTEKRFFNGREAVSTVLTAIKRSSVLSKERSNPVSERLAASVMQSPKE